MKPIKGTKNRIIFKEKKSEKEEVKIYTGTEDLSKVERGIIVAVTDEDEDGLLPFVKVGDEVLFTKSAFMEKFVNGGETYYQTLENSVVVILNA